ncbi:MAG: PqqD family protein [Rhizomicrobium sp.]
MNTTAKWRYSGSFVGAKIEDSFVILDVDSAYYYAFNVSASDIWDLLATPRTCRDVADLLVQKYEVAPEECLRSVEGVVAELSAKGLVSPA